MSLLSLRNDREAIIFLPKETRRPTCSILVNSTEYKADALKFKVSRYSGSSPSTCEVTVNNFSNQFNNFFNKGEVIKIYCDYVDGTTRIFEGTTYDIKPENHPDRITLYGRDYSQEALNRKVFLKIETPTEVSVIFKQLISTYLPEYTSVNVNTTTFFPTVGWNGKSVMECFQDLEKSTNNTFTFYCDFDKDWHLFEKGTVTNNYESIAYTRNMFRISNLDSLSDARNKITIFGQTIEGLTIFGSIETGYGSTAKDEVIYDSNITSQAMLDNALENYSNTYNSTESKGKGTAMGMPNLNPSDRVYIFAPKQNIQGFRIIPSYTHTLERHRFNTDFEFQEEKKTLGSLVTFLGDRKAAEQKISPIQNPYEMDYSTILSFSTTEFVGTLTNMAQSNNEIYATDTSGSFQSSQVTLKKSPTRYVLRASGNLSGITWKISFDNGGSYTTISLETEYSYMGNSDKIVILANHTNLATTIKAISLEYA
jgi:hypothetical protein